MIEIKKNDYVQPTEVREEVVQAICEAFLDRSCWRIFHPASESCYRRATMYVQVRNGKGIGFSDRCDFLGDSGIKVRGCEMSAAFDIIRNAGYHIFKLYYFGSWKGYVVSEKPFYREGNREGIEVTAFTDFID